MSVFKVSEIAYNKDAIYKQIFRAREQKQISLARAAKDLKINIKYLEALESWSLELLPAGIYVKNYLRIYTEYLGLPVEEIMEQYESEYCKDSCKIDDSLFVQKTSKARYFFSIPKVLKIFVIIFSVSVCIIYISFYLNNIVAPPKLIVTHPTGDITTIEKKIVISGLSEKEVNIKINGKDVLVDKDGNFSDEIVLKNGLNVIQIVAQKKHSKKNEVTRNILVNQEHL